MIAWRKERPVNPFSIVRAYLFLFFHIYHYTHRKGVSFAQPNAKLLYFLPNPAIRIRIKLQSYPCAPCYSWCCSFSQIMQIRFYPCLFHFFLFHSLYDRQSLLWSLDHSFYSMISPRCVFFWWFGGLIGSGSKIIFSACVWTSSLV